MKWSNFYDRQSNNKTFAANHNLVISSFVDELARAGSRHHAYHLRPGLGRCRSITMATPISKYLAQVAAAKAGQPDFIQGWISFWANLVSVNPLLFARMLATTETVIAAFLILGIFSNLTSIVGIFLSLGIWSIPEGFGGPYLPGQTTDIGTAFPYALLFVMLLCLSAGRYYGVDQWLTVRLGRLGFLASCSFSRR